jgi:PAS domain S-box-containing protein
MTDRIRREKFADLRLLAEQVLRNTRPGGPLAGGEEMAAILQELEVHQIELQLQNEELLRTQQELQQAKEEYFALYELAPVGYVTLNNRMLIIRANLAAARMLGVERRFLLNSGFSRFIRQADHGRFRAMFTKADADGLSANCELDLALFGGGMHARLECAALRQAEHGEREYNLTISDISELHQAHQALRHAHAELERRVAERTAELKETNLRLLASEEKFRTIADYTCDWEYWLSEKGEFLYNSPSCAHVCGYAPEEFANDPRLYLAVVHPDDRDLVARHRTAELSDGHLDSFDFRILHKNGEVRWLTHVCRPVYDMEGRYAGRRGSHSDISARKRFEMELQQAHAELETRVRERTRELEETNVALTVLLRKRAEDRRGLEQQILANAADLVEPYLKKLEKGPLTDGQKNLVAILKANLEELVSPFNRTVSAKFSRLTPGEIQVANLVKLGKKTKEIARLLDLSPGTIDIHRKNIRKKLGLTNKGVNLQSVLSSYTRQG